MVSIAQNCCAANNFLNFLEDGSIETKAIATPKGKLRRVDPESLVSQTFPPGARVQIVAAQDAAAAAHVGKVGVVVPFRQYPVLGSAKVRVDGYVVDLIIPNDNLQLWQRGDRVADLKARHEELTRQRAAILQQGDILTRKPEVFATVKRRTKTTCGNVVTESGARGYAFVTTEVAGKRKRKTIAPQEYAAYQAAYQRGQVIKKIDRELRQLTRELDRLTGVLCRTVDATGKQAGQWDLHDTRANYPAGATPQRFAFVVFRWAIGKSGQLKRGKTVRRFSCLANAPTEQVEATRQRAIAFMQACQKS